MTDPPDGAPPLEWRAPDAGELYERYPAAVAGATTELMNRAIRHEPAITQELMNAAPAGTRMHGLEFRMKSPDSLARKIRDKAFTSAMTEQPLSPHDVAGRITDVVRYTVVSPDDSTLLATARDTIATLKQRGFDLVEAEHSYVEDNPYKGLHTLVHHRDSDLTFELQFHTESSQGVKDVHHLDYEVARDSSASQAERDHADEVMRRAWSKVRTPPQLEGCPTLAGMPIVTKSYPRRTKETRS